MTDAEKLEEAHGLWELAVARVAALTGAAVYEPEGSMVHDVGSGISLGVLRAAVEEERAAFRHWTVVSEAVTAEKPD